MRYEIPYVITISSKCTINTSVEFVIVSRLNAPFLIKCYYRQLFVFSITENIILVEITRTNGTGLLNGPMKACDMNPGIPVIPEKFRIFNFWRMMKMMKAALVCKAISLHGRPFKALHLYCACVIFTVLF